MHHDAKIIVLCEPPSELAFKHGIALDVRLMNFFGKICREAGFERGDLELINLCPPLPKDCLKSAAKKWKHVEEHQEEVRQKIAELIPSCIVTLGELASRVMLGHPVSITKARGIPTEHEGTWIFPMLAPSFVKRIPDNLPIFEADVAFLKKFMDNGYKYEMPEAEYTWVDNIKAIETEELDNAKVISVDTETQHGTRWWDAATELLSVQIAVKPGVAYVFPVNDNWDGHEENHGDYHENREYLKTILEEENIKKVGFNNKFETHFCRKIGIEIKGWIHDTQLMLFNVDENLIEKSLDVGVSIFVPEMAGYSDELNQKYDKSDMAAIPREDFVPYAAGDADATLRLAQRLKPLLDKDKRQRNCYRKIQMPAIEAFANVVEPNGLKVSKPKLRKLCKELKEYREELYKKLIKYAPAEVKREHLDNKKELKFSRADFVRDIYFTEKGFNLMPTMFTDSTQDLPDEQKVAATSIKHLMWFTTEDGKIADEYTIGDYTLDLINMQKATKMENTYSGDEKENTGFWKYLDKDSKIHPSYMLHRTNTGRTSSADPNGQNIPVRGHWAPKFDEIFISAPGCKKVSCDLSQIELRLVAWMAQEPTMLRIYQEGGDIHCKTASSVLGISLEEFMSWKKDKPEEFAKHRYNAKATNFGFIYGLGAKGFRVYAKTDYGIDYTEEECWDIRNNYFRTYFGLPIWHNTMREFAREHGYVRSMLGRCRHLPGVYSDDEAIVAQNLRFGINSPIQSMASELGVIAMTRFCRQAPKDKIKINGFIHDAIKMEVKEDFAEEAASAIKWVCENPPLKRWFGIEAPLPIIADVTIDKAERDDIIAVQPNWWRE